MSGAPLTGKIALVTGASRGIGLAVADELRAAGAHVVRFARSLGDASADRQTDVRCDMGVPEEVDRAVSKVVKEPGIPDIVVNNAGVFFIKRIEETTTAEFAHTIAVNLTGPFLVVRALIPHLRHKGGGHLVTIGSVSDHVGYPGSSAYAASKFGVRGMHEVIKAELAQSGVRTTLISPGPVDTDLWDEVDPDSKPGFTKRKDMLRAEDVAEAVLFAVTRPGRVDVTEMRMLPTVYTPRG
ncbi:MAG: SDR family oxidoreductase [Gemmatimonadetes bacterium]|nr:SDR family oxidoreductase [Gemmatimonadota bacterium]